ncbi:MAG: hypothetical protein LBJ72_00930 [Dysgonamonadaceae bacterium]|jgi:hypothetical protein|nr:hypothetical protein [Dysgonamonadaceae bacterium]
MKNNNDIFDEFQQSLESLKGNFHVLETDIPVEKQMEYFNFSEGVRKSIDKNAVGSQIGVLNDVSATARERKYAMAYLAVSGDVKAYRALETYSKEHSERDDWMAMALLQAKITLESEFSDQKQVFISTGLGGKGHSLRFFSLFKSNDLKPFSAYQSELIGKEIPFHIHKYGGETEELEIEENYFTVVFLIDLKANIKKMLEEALGECNQYGDFINRSFVVTNMWRYNEKQIQIELHKNE